MAGSGAVVVGAGLAAANVVETLRENGYEEPIALVGDEAERPYERPGLSKEYLQGKSEADDLFVHPADWYGEHDVTLHLDDAATTLDLAQRQVRLASGQALGYDHLVLATGAVARTLPLPGTDLDGVHHLRRLGDSRRLREALVEGRRAVIIGGGWIGLEVAAAARTAGVEVTVLEAAAVPLGAVLGPQLGGFFTELQRAHGVDVRTGASVSAVVGEGGRVTGVATGDGVLPADLVLVAVGARPSSELAAAAGLETDPGVVVDDRLLTSDSAVLAVGDVASADNPGVGSRLRVEHWDNAIRQGKLAAQTILGGSERYDWQPYFFTDQYEIGMEYVGRNAADDRVVVRGDQSSGEFVTFWLRDGRPTAAMAVNTWDVVDDLRALIGRDVDEARLTDTDVAFSDI